MECTPYLASITMAAFVGADQSLWVDFEPGRTSISYLKQALKAAKQRSPIPFFGNAIRVIINYSPDEALRFDMQGVPVEILPTAHQGETRCQSRSGAGLCRPKLSRLSFSGRNDSKGS